MLKQQVKLQVPLDPTVLVSPQVRLQVAEAIGQMAHILDTDKLSDSLPKLLPALLQLYKRHPEPYPVTCALAMVLDASLITGKHVLELHMDAMLNALFQQVTEGAAQSGRGC